jgi:hypothetical protein
LAWTMEIVGWEPKISQAITPTRFFNSLI